MMKSAPRSVSAAAEKSRVRAIVKQLRIMYPSAKTALSFSTPLDLLVSTILSAQCTDFRVNIVTKDLFRKYRSAEDYANAAQEELEKDIRSINFFRTKAKNIIKCCRSIVEKFGGEVPHTLDELVQLDGVGRKTANCVLGGAFGIAEGVVVDTHVLRISQRLGLTNSKTAEDVEQDLMKVVDKKEWVDFSNMLILHGRALCNARSPKCDECGLVKYCPAAFSI